MPEIKVTKEELELFLKIKKNFKSRGTFEEYIKKFGLLLDNDFFTCKGGKKVVLFDGDGKIRKIMTEQIDWKG